MTADGARPPGEYGDGQFNPAYALEQMIGDLSAAVLGASRHAASRMTTDGLERLLLWLGDTPDIDFGRAGGNAAAVLHLTRGLFRELTQRCRNGDLPACWDPRPLATTAGIGGRSTPPEFADCATVFDARGEQWVYSQPSDTWCLRPGLAEPVSLTSARSWQRLLAEYGPLKEPTGGTYR